MLQLTGKNVLVAMTGSHCNFDKVMPQIERIIAVGASVIPFMSPAAYNTDTRFGTAAEWRERLETLAKKKVLTEIVDAEPVGPKHLADVVLVAPCTGNTMAKLAHGITDTGVLMAVKSQLRNGRPVVLALATNDALGNNARGMGMILNMPNIYLVPMGQDDPLGKPNSVVADMSLIIPTLEAALEGKQLQPVFVSRTKS